MIIFIKKTYIKLLINELIYRIGPFKMSDYAYVNNSNAQAFSGSQVTVDKSLVGGIVYGEIVLNGGTKIPIGYNEKDGDSGTSFTRTDGKNNAKIVYVDANGNSTNNVSPYDYQNDMSYNNAPDINVENDPFADFGDSVSIDDNFLD